MRRSLMLCVVLLFGATTLMAQGPERPGDRPPPREDADGRGPGGEGRGGFRGFGPPSNPVFDVIDADKDGNITPQELEGAVAALKTLDKDGDGVITRDEARPQFGGRGGFGGGFGGGPGEGGDRPQFTPEGFVASMMERDADKDGKLSAEELGERGSRMLETSDTNGDKLLDAEELKAAAARMGERFRGGFGGRGGEGGRPGAEGERPNGEGGDRPRRPASDNDEDRI